MEYDKINNGVCFREKDHSYFDENNPDCKYISVTTLIHGFSQPFDAEFNSAMKALEKLLSPDVWAVEKKALRARKKFDRSMLIAYGISEMEFNKVQQSILDEWEEKKNNACERGTAMHLEIENSFYSKGTNIDLKKFGVGGKFTCIKDYSDLDLPYGVYPEYLIYFKSKDNLLRLAGQIDLIIKSGNEITIVDHKGLPLDTPIATKDGFKTMAELEVGDQVYDKDGKLCNVTVKSDVHYNPCYKITFDNSEEIIADCDHRWLVNLGNKKDILTTKQLAEYVDNSKNELPTIDNVNVVQSLYRELPVDPYIIGQCIATCDPRLNEIQFSNEKVFTKYLRSGYSQRIQILKGYFDTVCNESSNKVRLYMHRDSKYYLFLLSLVSTFGITFVDDEIKYCDIHFGHDDQDKLIILKDLFLSHRTIKKVEPCETVATQCIAVDSPSHTYCFGYTMIPTHNTNAEIKQKGFYDANTKSTQKMLYPLNNLDDSNFWTYTMQLSTYAWMLQKINPDFIIKDLILNHYDHKGNNTLYHCEYRKNDVERMLAYYKKQIIKKIQQDKRKPISYD